MTAKELLNNYIESKSTEELVFKKEPITSKKLLDLTSLDLKNVSLKSVNFNFSDLSNSKFVKSVLRVSSFKK